MNPNHMTMNDPLKRSEPHLHALTGTVTLVQERRFQLVDDDGVAHLLLLAYDAKADPRALHALAQSGARVKVRLRRESEGVVALVATALDYA
jgi:hypothetical protein